MGGCEIKGRPVIIDAKSNISEKKLNENFLISVKSIKNSFKKKKPVNKKKENTNTSPYPKMLQHKHLSNGMKLEKEEGN